MSESQDRLQQALADRYTIQRELGRGGMATVYLATDLKHEREVAIKVLHPDLAATIGPDRFDREIRIAARLQHPNILGLFDSGEANGLLYYVMPFIVGESLRDQLNREHMLPVDFAVHIALEVADALGYAHSLGIVHRDIKPENIMISGGHALVADFGIARAASGGSGSAKLTETGMAVGTPLYMSPEQAVGEQVGPTADLYSLACVLYEMLTGHPPFTGSNARQIMARHAMDPVPGIQVVRDTVPDQVEDAIMMALSKVVADRPQTAAQFSELLGSPMGATANRFAVSRASRAMTPRRSVAQHSPSGAVTLTLRKRSLVGGAIAGIAALLVIGGALAWVIFRPRPVAAGNGESGLDPHRIAVLYFRDDSPDHRLQYVADGLTEALITTLSQVPALKVISPNGVAAWRDPAVPRDSVARALEAGTLVQGSVEPVGNKLRLQLRLVDGNSGADLSSRASIDLPAADLLTVRDSLATEAATLIRERLGEEVRVRRERAGTSNVEAWSLVQQARDRRRKGEEAIRANDDSGFAAWFHQADSLAEAAARLDDKWQEPLILRGQLAYRRAYIYGQNDPQTAAAWIDSGLAQIARAYPLNPNNPDGLEVRGNLRYWRWLLQLERDDVKARALLNDAKNDLEQATRVNPSQAGAWATLSHLYNQTSGTVDVALAARSALQSDAYLDNADKIYQRLFSATYDLGQYADAQHWCDEGARRFPLNTRITRCRLFLLTMKPARPDPSAAWAQNDTLLSHTQESERAYDSLYYRTMVAAVLGRAGLADSARRVLARAQGNPQLDPYGDISLVAAFAALQLGDRKEALRQLKLYFAASPGRREAFQDDNGWWFRDLQADPEYRQLIGQKPAT